MIVDAGHASELAESLADELGERLVRRPTADQLDPDAVVVASLAPEAGDEQRRLVEQGLAGRSTVVLPDARPEAMASLGLFGVSGTVVVRSAGDGRSQQLVVGGEPTGALGDGQVPAAAALVTTALNEPAPPQWTSGAPDLATVRLLIAETTRRSGDGSESRLFGSFVVELAAVSRPLRVKTLRIRSEGTSARAAPSHDTGADRGYFTLKAGVKYYPISLQGDHEWPAGFDLPLPEGWTRIHIAPQTPNDTSTYTRTTGWSVGGKVEGKVSDKPEVGLGLEASYSESASTTATIPDFRVRNYSTAAVSNWEYEYSRLADDKWALLRRPFMRWPYADTVAGLAKSMLEMGNETVYEAPPDCTSLQPLHFELGHHLVRFWQSGSNVFNARLNQQRWSPIGVQTRLLVPMSLVRHTS